MKLLFIETKYKGKVKLPIKIINKLPKTVGIFCSLQFIDSISDIKKQIESLGKKVKLFKTNHTKYKAQIYGCNLERFKGVEAFLYIGDGLFHPKALVLGNKQEVHIYNPLSKKYKKITLKDLETQLKRQRAAFSKFLMSKKIGVLISTKYGQSYLNYALSLKKKYRDKEFYFVVMNDIDFQALANFPFIEVWVNTACPRIGIDDTKRISKPMLDLGTVL